MTVLSRLLTPTPAKPAGERSAELDAQSAEFIAGIALSEGDENRRIAAVAKLEYGEALLKLAGLDGQAMVQNPYPASLQQAARSRLAHFIDAGSVNLDALRRGNDVGALLAVASLCADAARARGLVARDDADSLCEIAISAPSSKTRQTAAEALVDPVHLRRVLKGSRGHDKNVYKIVKAKLDALLAQDKAAAETQIHIESLCAALERHSHLPFDNLFGPTLEYLQKQWQAVAQHAAPESVTRAEGALERCHATVTRHVQQVATQAAREAAVSSAAAHRAALLEDMRMLLAGIYVGESLDSATQRLQACEEKWTELARYKAPEHAELERYARLHEAIPALTTLVSATGSLAEQTEYFRNLIAAKDESPPNGADLGASPESERERHLKKILGFKTLLGESVPAGVAEAEAALRDWVEARQGKVNAQAQALRQIGGLIHKGLSALREGQSRHAAGIRRSLEDKLQAHSVLPEHVAKQLHTFDEKLKDLKDWKSYAVAPKRIELIEAMEALIGATLKPNELAERVKQLQEEWKTVNKGAADSANAEWERFHKASQAAFEPCKEFFAMQAKQRESNLERRKALLARLTTFEQEHNWEQPDWREVSRAVRESQQQWRSHQPVERGPNKPIQAAFDALLAKLQTRLDAEHAKNIEERTALIARAQKLLEATDIRAAIEEAKRLQLAWKNAGIAPREVDQKLWADFRQHCDSLFAKRDQHHNEQRAGLEANKVRAVALCEELEQLLSLSGADLLAAGKKLSPLRQTFDAVGELPKSSARDLLQRFDRGAEKLEKLLTRQRALDKAQGWTYMLEAANKIRAYRLAVAQGADPAESTALKEAARTFIDGIQSWPKNGLQSLKSELTGERSADIDANEMALRTLCVRAEILTDTPSPAADQDFRRAYQLQLLKQSIGEGLGRAQSAKDELDALVFSWLTIGATRDGIHDELRKRFESARAKAFSR